MSKQITLIAISKVRLNNKTVIASGDHFECDAELADRLIDSGAAQLLQTSEATETSKQDDSKTESTSSDTLSDEAMRNTIASVLQDYLDDNGEKSDEAIWKKDGSPRVDAVNKSLPFKAGSELIESVWKALQPARTLSPDEGVSK